MAVHPEALLISAVVRSGEYQRMNTEGITPEMFHAFRDEAEWLFRYVMTNRQAPTRLELRQQFPDFVIYKGADNVAHWCQEVRQAHKQFCILEAVNTAVDLVDQNDPDAALDLMHRTVVEVNSVTAGVHGSLDVMEDWQGVYEDVKRRTVLNRINGFSGVPTGFDTLDTVTGGLQPGWLSIVAARLGQGKTWAGVKMGFTAAEAGKKVIYFSLEQPRNQIAMRVHAFGSRKYAQKVFNSMDLARGTGVDLLAYKRFLMDMQSKRGPGSFLINDSSRGRITPANIGGVIETEQPDLVIIDYLTLLGGGGDDWRSAAKLSGDVQALGHAYKVPIVALAQINRTGTGGKEPPGTESLYSSDSIGHDADLVVTMMQKSPSVMMHKIAKFRHGPDSAKWYSHFDPGQGIFDEVSGDEAAQLIEDDQIGEED